MREGAEGEERKSARALAQSRGRASQSAQEPSQVAPVGGPGLGKKDLALKLSVFESAT